MSFSSIIAEGRRGSVRGGGAAGRRGFSAPAMGGCARRWAPCPLWAREQLRLGSYHGCSGRPVDGTGAGRR